MALTTEIWTQYNTGSITVKDGTGAPLSVTVQFEQGQFALSGMSAGLRAVSAYQARGSLITVRETEREFPTGSFSAMVGEFTEAAAGTLLDMIHGTAGTPYAARKSTRDGAGDAITFDIVLAITGTTYGGADGTLTMEDCEIRWDYAQGDPDQLSFSFTVYGDISGDLSIVGG